MSPKLSVVVPFHNVEDYFRDCLASLAAQTLRDLEVILVDDGSTDSSTVIAKEFLAADPRFQLVQQDSAGPGPARNTGVKHATGAYLAFADADDLVPPDAYRIMVASLDRTGSDFATGAVERLHDGRLTASVLHKGLHPKRVERTHASKRPKLIRDRTPWNKVFRRSFWDAHLFVFPAGLYEDPPVNVRAHAVAKAVDVLPDTVYHWRKRDGSITEDRHDAGNLAQRLRSATLVREDLAANAPHLLPAYDEHVLVDVELRTLFDALPKLDDPEAALAMGSLLAAGIGPGVLNALSALERVRLHLLAVGDRERLQQVLRYERLGEAGSAPVVRRGKRWYAEYPFAADLPEGLCDVTDQLTPVARVDRCSWVDGELRLEGHAYIRHLESAGSSIRVWLVSARRLGLVRVPVTRVERPDVTAASKQSAVSYDASGFTASVPASSLKTLGRMRPADWKFYVEIANQGVRRRRSLGNPSEQHLLWPAEAEMPGGLRADAVAGPGSYLVRVRAPGTEVTGHRAADGTLVVEGRLTARPKGRVVLVAHSGGVKVRGEAETFADDAGLGFRASLPLEDLAQARRWEFKLAGEPLRAAAADAEVPLPRGELALTRTRYGTFRAVVRDTALVVREIAWTDEGALRLEGTSSDPQYRPEGIVLRRNRTGEQHTVPLEWEGGAFTAGFTPAAMPLFGSVTALGHGVWRVLADDDVPVLVGRDRLTDLPGARTLGLHDYEVMPQRDARLGLRVRTSLGADERGKYAQEELHRTFYPAKRATPVKDLVVFDAYKGRQYSCNPRGVFEELRRRETGTECVWVTADGRFPTPEGARVVLAGSKEHYAAVAQARLVFGNFSQEPWYRRREGQTYVQCWHGTPLKKLGYDLKEMPYKRTEGRDWMEHDVPQWDLLLAQNDFSVPLFRSAFRYDGEILVSGYPRNDALHRPDSHARAAEIRARLGIPADKKVVMYAPTWRDDLHSAIGKRGFRLELDLNRLAETLGDDHVILLRTHYLVTDRPRFRPGGGVVDVTAYPDITELYLITDALVTDYSSAMFDFASTRRPMFFYAYDLDRYRDHVRGFYFDFEAEAPGPLLRTSDELFDALTGDLDAAAHAPRYDAFVERYCPHEDGRAAARVLEHLEGRP